MSTFALSLGRPSKLLGSGSPANGEEFRQVADMLQSALQDRRRAASSLQSMALAELARVATACSEAGWDGYDAHPISSQTRLNAQAFLEDLPMWLPPPDIVPEPDGEIAIEWDFEPDRIFSISIGDTGKLHYAGLFGGGVERHGVEPFEGVVSAEILSYIEHLLEGSKKASLRRTA